MRDVASSSSLRILQKLILKNRSSDFLQNFTQDAYKLVLQAQIVLLRIGLVVFLYYGFQIPSHVTELRDLRFYHK